MVHSSGDMEITAVLEAERARLTRLCARITGDPDAAEDLAQETLIEAWRHRQNLRNPNATTAWLSGIARNVCRRWARAQGRDLVRTVPQGQVDGVKHSVILEDAIDDFDVEIELERHELADLLDRAMAMLSSKSRQVLIARYIEESPQAAVAERLGISEGAVAMRLSRGTLALRRVLMEELHDEAAAYGIGWEPARWQETRMWCPWCGRRRLITKPTLFRGEFILRCQTCSAHPEDNFVHSEWSVLFEGVRSYRAALTRMMQWTTDYYSRGLQLGAVPCVHCNRPAPLRRFPSHGAPTWLYSIHGLHHECDLCRHRNWHSLTSFALFSPEGQRFYREYPRIRTLPLREVVEAEGCTLIVASFESVTEQAQLDVLMTRDTFKVVSTNRVPCG